MDHDQHPENAHPPAKPYDKARLSYAGTFTDPWKANTIRAVEWATAKITLLRLIRKFERSGAPFGQPFWPQALEVMGIKVLTPPEQVARIPATGPLVVVANHPHGLVDGMVLAELIGRVRTDYKILTRSLLTGIPEIADFLIPVPFPHEANAREASLAMREASMRQLREVRNAFIHDSPFNGARESMQPRMGDEAMELLDQSYKLFVLLNNRFVADGFGEG